MAAFLAIVSASPYALKYGYVYDGAGGAGSATATRTKAQMLADIDTFAPMPPSPLRALLVASTLANWVALADGAVLSLYVRPIGSPPAAPPGTAFDVIPGEVFQAFGTDGTAASAAIEIRFNHTIDR